MSITDPIANMLTKIRNANTAGKDKVDVRSSKMNEEILKILKREKFILNFKSSSDEGNRMIRVYLKFDEEGNAALYGLERISKPGLRIYRRSKELKKILGGLGISIVSTSQGLMSDIEAREKNVGGEILCHIW